MKTVIQKSLFLLVMLSLMLTSALSFAESLQATVDRSSISENETLTLNVRYSGNDSGTPDFSALEHSFTIISQSQSNQYRNINGAVEAFTEWVLVLFPRNSGRLVIPSFKLNGVFSEAVEITVHKQAPLPAGQRDVVFIESEVSTTDAHVQEQVILTYRFFYSVNVNDLQWDEFTLDGVIMEDLPRTNYQRKINNTPYQVAEFQYALFPQTSGTIEIPATTWTAQLSKGGSRNPFNLRGGRYELKKLKAKSQTIQVAPQPQSFPTNATWLPSSDVTIEENWTKNPSEFKVGEPITRTVTLHAKGLMASQLPKLSQDPSDTHLKYYADQPSLNDQKTAEGFIGERMETIAVVVSEGGYVTIPEISIPWWDTTSNEVKYATLPERRFLVATASDEVKNNRTARDKALTENAANTEPAMLTSGSENQPNQNNSKSWSWLTSLFALLSTVFAVTSIILYLQIQQLKRGRSQEPSEGHTKASTETKAWTELQSSIKNQNLAGVRSSLINWGRLRWPLAHIHALSDIGRAMEDDTMSKQLLMLDSVLYSSDQNTQWNFEQFKQHLDEWRKDSVKRARTNDKQNLEPLYP